jgi:hypothetical protein
MLSGHNTDCRTAKGTDRTADQCTRATARQSTSSQPGAAADQRILLSVARVGTPCDQQAHNDRNSTHNRGNAMQLV